MKTVEQGGQNHRLALLEKYGLVASDLTVPLPSGGIIYPLYDDKSPIVDIQIRAMTVTEMDILANRENIIDLTFISKVIASCIIPPIKGWPRNPDEEGKNLTTSDLVGLLVNDDLETVMLALRLCTYGPTYNYEHQCSNCDKSRAGEIDLSAFETTELPIQPTDPGTNRFLVQDPKLLNGAPVVLKLPSVKDGEILRREVMVRESRNLDKKGSMQARLERSVLEVGETTNVSDVRFIVQRMSAGMLEALYEQVEKLEFGPDIVHKDQICPGCKHTEDVPVPLAQVVFFR